MKIVAVSTSRKNSSLPGKNTRPVCGRPLYSYNIGYANASKYIQKVYVSTDDKTILASAHLYGFLPILRPDELCTSECTHDKVLLHALGIVEQDLGSTIDAMVVVYGNTLTAYTADLDGAIELLSSHPTADSVASVCRYNMFNPYRAYQLRGEFLESFLPKNSHDLGRDALGDFYFMNGSFYVVRRDFIANKSADDPCVFGRKVIPYVQEEAMELDEEWQFKYLQHYVRQ